jgi:hypothetical protein
MKDDFKNLVEQLAFLENRMDTAQHKIFEARLMNEVELQEDTLLLKNIMTGINHYGDTMMRNKLKTIENQLGNEGFWEDDLDKDISKGIELHGELSMKKQIKGVMNQVDNTKIPINNEPKIINFPFTRWVSVAASFLLLIGAAWYLFTSPNPTNKNQDLVATKTDSLQVLKEEPSIITLNEPKNKIVLTDQKIKKGGKKNPIVEAERSDVSKNYLALLEGEKINSAAFNSVLLRTNDSSRSNIMIEKVLQLIAKKDNQQALDILNTFSFDNTSRSKVQMLKAQIYYSDRDYETAKGQFYNIVKDGNTIYNEEASYYLLLCYVADYDKDKDAFERLSSLILKDEDHPFYQKTKTLVSKVKKINE